jgi:hypothetical protein
MPLLEVRAVEAGSFRAMMRWKNSGAPSRLTGQYPTHQRAKEPDDSAPSHVAPVDLRFGPPRATRGAWQHGTTETMELPRFSSLPCTRDTSQRGSRTHSRYRVPTGPQALSLAVAPDAQLPENCYKIMAGERDSNPRRAFDPYTLSRVGAQSIAVHTIMAIGLFIGIFSAIVHSHLW